MRRSLFLLFSFSAFLFFAAPSVRADEIKANTSCTTPGVSTMTTNGVDIVTCLKTSETNSALIWKAMTSGGGSEQGSLCGSAITGGGLLTPAAPDKEL